MATSIKHSGFKRLLDRDPTLAILVGGAEALTFRKDSTGSYGAMKIGTAYEAVASIIDGYGISLATGYGAALSNRLYGLDINADTGSTDITGDTMVGAIRGRTVIGTTQTNASIYGVHGNIDVGASKNIISNYAGVYGVVDFYGNSTIGGSQSHVAGGFFTLWCEGTETSTGGSNTLSGIECILNGTAPTMTGGICSAITMRGQAVWQYGLYIPASSTTTGIYIGTCTAGIVFNPTLVPDENRTNYIWSYGTRATAKDLSMAASASYNLDPVQMNMNIIGTAPTSSTVNLSYMLITHAFANMTGLRLKCSDWNISVGSHVQDVYVYQGELDFTATSTIGGEACVMGMQVYASAGTITGDVCGIRVVMGGSSLPATTSRGIDISARNAGTLTHGLQFYTQSTSTMTNAIYVESAGTLTNFIKFSATITNVVATTAANPLSDIQSVASAGYIRVLIGTTARYIPLYAATG